MRARISNNYNSNDLTEQIQSSNSTDAQLFMGADVTLRESMTQNATRFLQDLSEFVAMKHLKHFRNELVMDT